MRKLALILALLIVAIGCKDPRLGPDDDKKPTTELNQISFESPSVGQKSVYVHFVGFNVWSNTQKDLEYTNDTLTLEITNQIDDNTFIITETVKGSYFDRYDKKQNSFTLKVHQDSVSFIGEDYYGSILFSLQEPTLRPNSRMELSHNGWLISPNTTYKNLDGYLFDYKVGDTTFAGINTHVNYEPMTYDGGGLAVAYNYQLGVVRSYVINPWTAQADGFDLVNTINNEKPRTDFVDTKWELVSATTVDGNVKTAKELEAIGYYIYFTNESEFYLFYGNDSGGEYSIDGNQIKIEMGATTKKLSPFMELYDILNESIKFSANTNKLIIYSDNNEYSSVEFKLVSPNTDVLALSKNNWKLTNLVLADRSVVKLDDYIDRNSTMNNFTLKFLRNSYYEGFSGCNTYGGKYEVSNTKLEMFGGNITEAACPFSQEYNDILNKSHSYNLIDGTLNIYSNHINVKALIFVPTR
ncbi:MAG: META domain-containing protein [Chlorobiota bacterium]